MGIVRETERYLRYFIIGQLHVGRLKPGDPLPSIRQVARESGADHRAVANAYRLLEAEGLVEIRSGAGVYLAGNVGDGAVLSESAEWLAQVMTEGWSRRVSRAELRLIVDRCAATPILCACIESNEDHMVAVCAELESDFSVEVRSVLVSPLAGVSDLPRDVLAGADIVVTTVFHAAVGQAAAAAAGKPCVVVSLNPQFAAEVNRVLARDHVTAVIADPRFSARAAAYLDVTPHRGRVRYVLVDQLGGAEVGPLDLRSESVLVTRAARRRLGLPEYHLVPSPPFISPASARELFGIIAQAALRPQVVGSRSTRRGGGNSDVGGEGTQDRADR